MYPGGSPDHPDGSPDCSDSPHNLILTGFMGTGKTQVGREVARRLGRPFLDMDDEIEARAGKPVPRIFAEDGEATFRQIEAELCQELEGSEDLLTQIEEEYPKVRTALETLRKSL